MVVLYAARHRIPVPSLARWLLALGIAATLPTNMAQGWSHGPVGAVVAALLLAQVQGLASLWIPPVWAETLVYGVMLLVLVVRPAGLFNRLGEA